VNVLASEPAADLIAERGGRLYVWVERSRCCSPSLRLVTATEEPRGERVFRRVAGFDRFQLFLPEKLAPLPDELHIEARKHPRRVEAYWNGCAWIV
jgi:hypothetical protein